MCSCLALFFLLLLLLPLLLPLLLSSKREDDNLLFCFVLVLVGESDVRRFFTSVCVSVCSLSTLTTMDIFIFVLVLFSHSSPFLLSFSYVETL